MCSYKNDEGSPKLAISILFFILTVIGCVLMLVLQGCALRMTATIETEDAARGYASSSRNLTATDLPGANTVPIVNNNTFVEQDLPLPPKATTLDEALGYEPPAPVVITKPSRPHRATKPYVAKKKCKTVTKWD